MGYRFLILVYKDVMDFMIIVSIVALRDEILLMG